MAQFSNVKGKKKNEPQECRNGCGAMIKFDYDDFRTFGKWRPIDAETDEPHDCPESEYNKGKRGEIPQQQERPKVRSTYQTAIADSHIKRESEPEPEPQKATGNLNIALESIDRAVLVLDGELSEVKSLVQRIDQDTADLKKIVLGLRDSFADFVKTYGIKPANEVIAKDINPSIHTIEGQKDTTKTDKADRIPSDMDDVTQE